MTTGTIIFLAIYFGIILVILGFLVVFFLHIKQHQKYAPHTIGAFKIFLIFVFLCVLFGVYSIIFGKDRQYLEDSFDISNHVRVDL